MRIRICRFSSLLLFLPCLASAAQDPRGMLVPVGARLKLESQLHGKTIEGTLVAWRGDTLVVQATEPPELRGDTVRLPATAVKKTRVLESPLSWRYTTATNINFHMHALVPRSRAAQPTGADAVRRVMLVASKGEFAAVDPVTGTVLWTRPDLADLKRAALDVVGRRGYAVITRGDKIEVIDLATGQTRWDTGALSLLAARGWLGLPGDDGLVLMYGRTAESPWTLIAVELGTGKARWRQDRLFALEPKTFGTEGVSYLLGHQPPLADSDTTLILYLSTEGPIRVDARSGELLWRAEGLRDADLPTLRDGYARMQHRRGTLFVPTKNGLLALRATDGRPAWEAPRLFKSRVVRMERTRDGLLVRGDDWLELLDPVTGKSRWRAPVTLKNSLGLALRGDTVYVAADNKILAIRITDGFVRTVAGFKLKDNERPFVFGVLPEGIVLSSWHQFLLVDRQGAVRSDRVYPSPKENFGERLTRGGPLGAKRPTTRWGGGYGYFFTGEPDDAGREGFSIVKLDAAAGQERTRIWFDERAPYYLLEYASGTVYYERGDREIAGLEFPDWTALDYAARNGDAAIVTRLLAMGVGANTLGDAGWTALHVAARSGQVEVVRLLLAHGADPEARTSDGWSPLMLAEARGRTAVAQSLRDAGARSDDATAALLRGWHQATEGRIPEALGAYADARARDSTLALWPSASRVLCWNGSLHGHAAQVLPVCDTAVERTPASGADHASARLARGVTRALTGDLEGAAADLERSRESEEADEEGGPLDAWIDALREGRNPFTPAVLAELRRRE